MKAKLQLGTVLAIGFALFFAIVWLNPTFIVKPGDRAIIFNTLSGLKNKVYAEGLHFKIPFIEVAEYYDIKKRRISIPATNAASKDLQDVKVELSFLFNPMPDKLLTIRQTLGREKEYEGQVFPSIPKEVIKAVIAKKTAEEIITQRDDVSNQIKEELIKRLAENNIEIQEVALSGIEFSKTFAEAIEAKQVAQQKLFAAKFEKDATITKAQGQAEAARIINQASQHSPAFIELRKIDAQKEVAKTLATSKNVIYLPSNTVLMTNPLNSNK